MRALESLSPTTGAVSHEMLVYQQDGREVTIKLDSAEWYHWLETATSFSFRSTEGFFTAHKERASNRRGSWYWRAYRQRQGRLSRFYLGVSAKVTLVRLRAAASRLAYSEPSASEKKKLFPVSQTSSAGTLASPMLATKFEIPRLPAQHVSRAPLVATLEQYVRGALTLVCAPAGSGKTTLLAEWASATTLPVAWLSLETAENDPARFLAYLIGALSRLDERIGAATRADGTALASGYKQVVTGLLNDLVRILQQDVVVILDDYHLLSSEIVQDLLLFLLDHLPTHLHLVIGTRIDPPLPLARLRAYGQLGELGTRELRFVATEVKVFTHAMGFALSEEAVAHLEQRTEGWIAGIQLLTLALRGHANADTFLHAQGSQLFGQHRFLLDYVREEILAQQTLEAQRFLLHTCVLERLCGSLCDVVTGLTGGEARLAGFLRANLFMSVLGDGHTWYRYHALFAETLRAFLHKQEPELVPELYRRASGWYEEQGWEEEACEYAYLAGDLPRAAVLLANLVPHLIEEGKLLRLSQWMDQLPPAVIAGSPQLSLALAWIQPLHTAQPIDREMVVERLAQQIQAHVQDDPASSVELQRELTLQRAVAALAQGDIPRALSLVGETVYVLPDPETAWSRFTVLRHKMILSSAYQASGDLQATERVLLEAFAADSPSIKLLALMSLADLYEAQGRLRSLAQLFEVLFQEGAQWSDSSPFFLMLAHGRYATLLYEWNQLTEADASARHLLAPGQDLEIPLLASVLVPTSLWVQGRILLAWGDDEQARQQLEHKAFAPVRRLVPEAQNLLGSIPARFALACGQPEPAWHWEQTCGLHFDDALNAPLANACYLGYVTLVRVLIAHGRSQRQALALTHGLMLLDRLRALVVNMSFHGWLIEIQMLTALALQAQGKTKQALTTLAPLLAQAEPEGYVRLFADEGQPMAHLLARVSVYTSASKGYLQALLAACLPTWATPANSTQVAAHQPLIDPLSVREQEVLVLLADGASNQQIADQLVISLNTAKRHVKHLLAKLTVINRTQAVARARELHLL